MKIVTCVNYKDQQQRFEIFCGDGRKTFKWLGLVAAQRFVRQGAHGTLRHRDARPRCAYNSFLLPIKITSGKLTFPDPEHLLIDHLSEGQSVEVTLADSQSVGEKGDPVLTSWSTLAFDKQPAHQAARERCRQIADHQQTLLTMEDVEIQQRERIMANRMKDIMHNQILNEIRIRQIFEGAWVKINQDGELDALVKNPEEQEIVRQTMLYHYPVLTELFRSYSAAGQVGGVTQMDYREFSNCIFDLQLLNITSDQDLLRRIFNDSFPPSVPMELRNQGQMSMSGFFLALIHLAYHLYIDTAISNHMPSMSYAERGQRRAELLKTELRGGVETISTAVQRIFDEHLLPHAQHNLRTFVVKDAISSEEVLTLLGRYYEPLLKVYKVYARMTGGSMIFQNLMDIKEFYSVAKDSHLLEKDPDEKISNAISMKEIRMSFAFAQSYCADDDDISGDTEDQMSFPEFVEGVCRLGVMRFDDTSGMPVIEKIRFAIKAVAALANAHEKQGKGRRNIIMQQTQQPEG